MSQARNSKAARLAVALIFGAIAAGATAFVYNERDVIFAWNWASPSGKFQPEPDEALRLAARDFAEARSPGRACVDKWVGKDDKYIYLALGCARFEEKLGEMKAHDGDSGYLAARLRYSGSEVRSLEQPRVKAYENGLRRLFPKAAADRLRAVSVSDYHRQGLARMAERGISP